MMAIQLCPHCGKESPERGKFCKYCGCPMGDEEASMPEQPITERITSHQPTVLNRMLGDYPRLSVAAAIVAVALVIGVIHLATGGRSDSQKDYISPARNAEAYSDADSEITGHYQQIYLRKDDDELTETDIKVLRAMGEDKDLLDLTVRSDGTAKMTSKNGSTIDYTVKEDGFYMSGIYKCPYSYSGGVITVEVPVKGITMKFRKDG